MLLDEQIRRLEQLAQTEMELRRRIEEDGDSSRETRVQLSRVQRFRYALAMRTREERRRRRLVAWQQLVEEDALEDGEGEASHFKHTLSLDEKRRVLDRVLEFHRHKVVHRESGGKDGNDNDNGNNNNKNNNTCTTSKKKADMFAAMNSSIRSRTSEIMQQSASVDEEAGGSDEGDRHKIASDRMCSICLDGYGESKLYDNKYTLRVHAA